MKTLVYSLAGAVVLGFLCIGITWFIGYAFGPLYQGEEEANRNFGYFMLAFILFIASGAFFGFKLARKNN